MRLFLLIALISGLVPSLAETVELAVHYAQSGHVAHMELGASDLGDLDREHGCGPTAHHCGCCVSQSVVAGSVPAVEWNDAPRSSAVEHIEQAESDGRAARLFRPPIGA
ncbi:MAG: hypothetical protein L0Y66_16210 [Myxococcaceae bacterium]|nr:hypothetical protein [Myxococcaceae bacterium]MCI0670285.1 hypothetical protein [Myxococcaceae bacterium]